MPPKVSSNRGFSVGPKSAKNGPTITKAKPVKRLKTSELIMEKEKQTMQHKYNKVLPQDRKNPGE